MKSKKILSVLLSLLLVLSVFGGMAFTASAVATGTVGDATWTLDDNGLMTVSGTGPFEPDFDYNFKMQIKSLVIGNGITKIGREAFRYSEDMTSVVIGNGVTEIREVAFDGCYALSSVKLGKNVRAIGMYNTWLTNVLTQTNASGYTVSIEGFRKGTGNYGGQLFKAVVKKDGAVVPGTFLIHWSVSSYNSLVNRNKVSYNYNEYYQAYNNEVGVFQYGPYGWAHPNNSSISCDVYRITEDGTGLEKLCSTSRSIISKNDSSWKNNELSNTLNGISTILFVGNTSAKMLAVLDNAGMIHTECPNVKINIDTNSVTQAIGNVLSMTSTTDKTFQALKPGIVDVPFTIYTSGCTAHSSQYTASSPLNASLRYIVLHAPTLTPTTTSLKFDFGALPDLGDNELTITLNGETKTVTAANSTVTFTGLDPETSYPYTLLAGTEARGYAFYEDNALTLAAPLHTHDFTYAANEATLTATCQNADCDLPGNAVSFTINAPEKTTYNDGKTAAATLSDDVAAFNEATGQTVSAADIKYYEGDQLLDAAPVNAGTYQARITVEGATAVVEYTIEKATPSYEAPSLTATYGDTLGSIELPTGWSWKDNSTSVGNVGEKTFKAKFTPSDTDNFVVVEDIDVTVNVGKANPDPQIPNLTATVGDTLADVTLPDDENGTWTWQDSTEPVGAVGTKTFKATFTPADTANYNTVQNIEVPVTVGKAIPFYETPNLTATYGDTLADVTLPGAENGTWRWKDDNTTSVGNAGENSFIAFFTPNDTDTYAVVEVPVTITVGKAIPFYEIPNMTATYGDTLGDVELPVGFRWNNDAESVGAVGEKTFKATFTPEDTDNFLVVKDIDVPVTVGKATPDYQLPENLTATVGDTLASVTLPEGWSWKENTTSVGEAGEKTFKATFTPADTANYNTVENIDVPVTVKAATPDTPDTPSNDKGDFRCGFCDEYEYWGGTPVIGWFVSLIHIFVHLAAHIGHIT